MTRHKRCFRRASPSTASPAVFPAFGVNEGASTYGANDGDGGASPDSSPRLVIDLTAPRKGASKAVERDAAKKSAGAKKSGGAKKTGGAKKSGGTRKSAGFERWQPAPRIAMVPKKLICNRPPVPLENPLPVIVSTGRFPTNIGTVFPFVFRVFVCDLSNSVFFLLSLFSFSFSIFRHGGSQWSFLHLSFQPLSELL